MTKREIVKLLSNEFGFTKIESERILNFIIDVIVEKVRHGEKVVISNFATFELRRRQKKNLFGKRILPEREVPVAVVSRTLKRKLAKKK